MRPDWDSYFLNIADAASDRSTCKRRSVGCVIVDAKNHIASIGYNGVPRGFSHCIDAPCGGENYPSGEGLEDCIAVHAELNAFLQLAGRSYQEPLTLYTQCTPCVHCTKVICNSDVKRVVVRVWYAHRSVESLFQQAGIELVVKEAK